MTGEAHLHEVIDARDALAPQLLEAFLADAVDLLWAKELAGENALRWLEA